MGKKNHFFAILFMRLGKINVAAKKEQNKSAKLTRWSIYCKQGISQAGKQKTLFMLKQFIPKNEKKGVNIQFFDCKTLVDLRAVHNLEDVKLVFCSICLSQV